MSVSQEGNSALVETLSTAVRKEAKDKSGLSEELRDRPRSYSQSPGTTFGTPHPIPSLGFSSRKSFQFRTVLLWDARDKITEGNFSGHAWPGRGAPEQRGALIQRGPLVQGCSSARALYDGGCRTQP